MITNFIATMLFCLFSGCSDTPEPQNGGLEDKDVLIVYLSRTQNTKAVAGIIHNNVGGTLVALELENPYPEHYQTTVNQVSDENARGYLPPLKTKIA